MNPQFRQPPARPNSAAAAVDWQAALAEHERWLRTVVLARLGEPQAVDEVMQEIALAVVRGQAPLADAERLCPWLYHLAVRQALLFRRKRGRFRQLVSRYAERLRPGEGNPQASDPLDWLLADERRELVRQALKRLAPRDREILLLKYSQGWSYHELAAHLGISHSAIEARLHRARARMRAELAVFDLMNAEA